MKICNIFIIVLAVQSIYSKNTTMCDMYNKKMQELQAQKSAELEEVTRQEVHYKADFALFIHRVNWPTRELVKQRINAYWDVSDQTTKKRFQIDQKYEKLYKDLEAEAFKNNVCINTDLYGFIELYTYIDVINKK